MTETETVKALECCGDENNCAECPLKGTRFELDHSCAEELMKATAELIKSKNAKIEELQHEIKSCNSEIERLQIRNITLTEITKNYDWKFEKAKSEARKEFMDKFKEYYEKQEEIACDDCEWPPISYEDIESIAKEMEGEK